MKNNIETVKAVLFGLQKDITKLDSLISTQEKQYELLSGRKTEELKALNVKILSLLEKLNESNAEREDNLRKLGLPVDKKGMHILNGKLPSPLKEAMSTLLEELVLKSSVCSMMNEKSGHMLSTQKAIISRLTGAANQQSYPDLPFQRY